MTKNEAYTLLKLARGHGLERAGINAASHDFAIAVFQPELASFWDVNDFLKYCIDMNIFSLEDAMLYRLQL